MGNYVWVVTTCGDFYPARITTRYKCNTNRRLKGTLKATDWIKGQRYTGAGELFQENTACFDMLIWQYCFAFKVCSVKLDTMDGVYLSHKSNSIPWTLELPR